MIWTDEMRARQAEWARITKPWLHSTGPRTTEGKARSAVNAWKGGQRPKEREFLALIRDALEGARSVC